MEEITHEDLLEDFLSGDQFNHPDDSYGQEKRFFEYAKGQLTIEECESLLENYWSEIWDNAHL